MTADDTILGNIFSYEKEGNCSVATSTTCRLDSDCPSTETCDGGMPFAAGAAAWYSANAEWRSKTSTALDPFCLTCHDSNGANLANVGTFENWATTGSSDNPFGDAAITNEYDRLSRTRNSECVGAGNPLACCTGAGTGTCLSVVNVKDMVEGSPPTDGVYARHAIRDDGPGGNDMASSHNNFYQSLPSTCDSDRQTGSIDPCQSLYEAGVLIDAGVTPSGEGPLWNDTSVMGCADCHTTDGSNGDVGNAHGAESEYLLKNADGTAPADPTGEGAYDNGTYVCFKCHDQAQYAATSSTPPIRSAPAPTTRRIAPTSARTTTAGATRASPA
jgi:hypothetical protein